MLQFLASAIPCTFPLDAAPPDIAPSTQALIGQYCATCHNPKTKAGGVVLNPAPADSALWERAAAKLRAGAMPPPGLPRPTAEQARAAAVAIESALDAAADAEPHTIRHPVVHRLNRAEYRNALRDLLALDLDVEPLLPGDETADGSFDNLAAALSISTAHVERYLSVARQASRLAIGLPPDRPTVETFKIPLHIMQDDRQGEDLPLGSRGGIAVRRVFPSTGDYEFRVRLQRQYQDYLKGMGWPQDIEIRLDGKLLKRFTAGGNAPGTPAGASYAGDGEPGFAGDPEWERFMQVTGDQHLTVRVRVEAGPHIIAAAFVRELWEEEGLPQPRQRGRVITNDQVYMGHAYVDRVEISGPLTTERAALHTPSRQAIFVCHPGAPAEERSCAARILTRLTRLAFRRPATAADITEILKFFDTGRRTGGSFDHGIQFAIERLLADPDFLLRIHRPGLPPSSLELASRLSFFLWSSLPDDRLLTLAERGELARPATLEQEVRRMLSDPRAAHALTTNFAAQWLNLRRLSEVTVDPVRYPTYDDSLLEALRAETSLFVGESIREDRPVTELLTARHTFANQRLAEHYGLSGIAGSRMRRVSLPANSPRGGLLAHGAILATTSYPDRTSPVLRGKWLLNNILGEPVPPPPPGLDTSLDGQPAIAARSIRERLARHRNNPSCNSCHSVIDPLGFALENFDVIGGWRLNDEHGHPVDTYTALPNGQTVEGLAGLRAHLTADPEQFPRALTTKLLAYALGRPLETHDQPAIRRIVRQARPAQFRWSSIILGIVRSPAFEPPPPHQTSHAVSK